MKVSIKVRTFTYLVKDSAGEVISVTINADNRTEADKVIKKDYAGFKVKFEGMKEEKRVYEIPMQVIVDNGEDVTPEDNF